MTGDLNINFNFHWIRTDDGSSAGTRAGKVGRTFKHRDHIDVMRLGHVFCCGVGYGWGLKMVCEHSKWRVDRCDEHVTSRWVSSLSAFLTVLLVNVPAYSPRCSFNAERQVGKLRIASKICKSLIWSD